MERFNEKFLEERNGGYDTLTKRLLSRKAILAHILKKDVEEFADCSITDIEDKYIEGDSTARINTIPLEDALAPSGGEAIKQIINVTRRISFREEKEFYGEEYKSLKKVYSIWICMEVQNYRANSKQGY